MKIGIVTTQYANNYGALLQAHALQKYLLGIDGFDVETINYLPKDFDLSWNILPQRNNYKLKILYFLMLLNKKWQQRQIVRNKKNRQFRRDYIKVTKPFYSKEEIEKNVNTYDFLVCGSDQIWNAICIRELNPVFFLNFSKEWMRNTKKIAYAPSIADKIPTELMSTFTKYIEDFDAISVREDIDAITLTKITGKDIKHVCDPVFLISKEYWANLAVNPSIDEPYICCYFLTPSNSAVKAVNIIKKKTGLKIVNININILDKFRSDIDIRDAGVQEFLGLIKNAKYVITNSFHCTAFSILFHKDFYVIGKHVANVRMQSLLRKVELESRFISSTEIESKLNTNTGMFEEIKYEKVDSLMDVFINESKDYLLNSLGVTNEQNYR